MRFIAKYRRYTISVRQHIEEQFATGRNRIIQHGVVCEFSHGGALSHEKELAKQTFKFEGTMQEEDEVTTVDPVYGVNSRISVFDTDDSELVQRWKQWDRLEKLPEGTGKREVEEALLNSHEHGTDYILSERTKLAAPYGNYDKHRRVHGRRLLEHAISDIAAAYEAAGFDIDAAVAYERQEGNDEAVIAALEALRGEKEPVEELVAA